MPDQTPREQLAEIIEGETALPYTSKVTADRILSAGWRPPARVITEPAELKALPVGSALLHTPCSDGCNVCVWAKPYANYWATTYDDGDHSVEYLLGHVRPGEQLIVLHSPATDLRTATPRLAVVHTASNGDPQ